MTFVDWLLDAQQDQRFADMEIWPHFKASLQANVRDGFAGETETDVIDLVIARSPVEPMRKMLIEAIWTYRSLIVFDQIQLQQ